MGNGRALEGTRTLRGGWNATSLRPFCEQPWEVLPTGSGPSTWAGAGVGGLGLRRLGVHPFCKPPFKCVTAGLAPGGCWVQGSSGLGEGGGFSRKVGKAAESVGGRWRTRKARRRERPAQKREQGVLGSRSSCFSPG